jgi:hypothetical protein
MFVPEKLSRLVLCMHLGPEPTRVEQLRDAPLQGKLLSLPTTFKLGWEGLPRSKTIVYFDNS